MSTRSSGALIHPDVAFPSLLKFDSPKKLPTNGSIIGVLKQLTESKFSHEDAIVEVSKLVYAKWFHDTVYCITLQGIRKKMKKMWDIFREGRKRYQEGKTKGKAIDQYTKLNHEIDQLFDIYTENRERRKTLEEREWKVSMTEREVQYYEDQKSSRLQECDHGVDPVWYAAMMRKQRMRERSEEYRRKQAEQFLGKDLETIEGILQEDGTLTESEEEEQIVVEEIEEEGSSSKRRKFDSSFGHRGELFSLPESACHLRSSERVVRDDLYETIANLTGVGLSVGEAAKAVVITGNTMFKMKWKEHAEEEGTLDIDTMPHHRNIMDKLKLIEAQSLSLVTEEMTTQAERGRMLTHAIDSTTKKRVGTFACQGIHIGQNSPLPLPLLSICGETTDDIAMQTDFAFEVLSAVHGKPKEEIYQMIDTHMTDSVEHNKGFAKILADLYNLDTPAGQLFGGSHTTLGFSTAMCKQISAIEKEMKLEKITAHFMVDIEVESKHDCFAAQCVDMMLRLVAPEFSYKPWNYYKAFSEFLARNGAENLLFAYKDHRFGCLSRAAAVLVHIYNWLKLFLDENPQITNRLACLVRDIFELSYMKVIFVVIAALGVHLVEPFYARTIQSGATHSILKKFYKDLYSSMETEVTQSFFHFARPQFAGVSTDLFDAVQVSYSKVCIDAVRTVSKENIDHCVKLANFIIPEMRVVLARQRRDYGISDDFPSQYPVESQASNIDDTPVNNLAMERMLGSADYRLPKLKTLTAVSRSIILGKTAQLRAKSGTSFRSFRKEAEKKVEVELKWSESMREKFARGLDEKMVVAQALERKRLDMLEELKNMNGPFTHSDDVQNYLAEPAIKEEIKKKRMKMELQFARDSSTTLPKSSLIFRVMVTNPQTKKRRDKTAEEFGESLMFYLGKKVDKKAIDYDKFRDSLEKCTTL